MNSVKYVGLDVHQSTISVAVLDEQGKLVMQCVLVTRAAAILDGLITSDRIADLDAPATQLPDHLVEVGHLNCEVLTEVGRHRSFDKVDLLGPEVDPGTSDAEIGTVISHFAPEHAGVERQRLVHIAHVDGNVVHCERFHGHQSTDRERTTLKLRPRVKRPAGHLVLHGDCNQTAAGK